MMERYWVVLHRPARYTSLAVAREKAEAQAASNPGEIFTVFEAVGAACTTAPPVVWTEPEHAPPEPLVSQAERNALIGPDSLSARAGDGVSPEEDALRAAPPTPPPADPETCAICGSPGKTSEHECIFDEAPGAPALIHGELQAILAAALAKPPASIDLTDPIATCKAGWGSEHCPHPIGSKERKAWMEAFDAVMGRHPVEDGVTGE